MNWLRGYRQIITAVLVLLMMLSPIAVVLAEDAPTRALLATEIKIKNQDGGLNEFIELYNNLDSSLDLSSFSLDYFNVPSPSADQTPTAEKALPNGLLEPEKSLVLAKDMAQIAGSYDSPLANLADAGGLLRIVDSAGWIHDEIAWTDTAAEVSGSVVRVPPPESSLHRGIDGNGQWVVENPGWQAGSPGPRADGLLPPPSTGPAEGPNSGDQPSENSSAGSFSAVGITELLPNPAAPKTDEKDEFVELYNSNDEPLNLEGYTIQTGNTYRYNFKFGDRNIGANSFLVVYSNETNLTLANTSGRARLLDPAGATVSEVTPYEKAPEGSAWAEVGGAWQWTVSPTPGTANAASALSAKVAAAKAKKAVAKKKTAAKTAKAKKGSAKAGSTSERDAYEDPAEVDKPTPLHPSLLAGLGGLAVAYAAYEYRHDMANSFQKLRRYRETRRSLRSKS